MARRKKKKKQEKFKTFWYMYNWLSGNYEIDEDGQMIIKAEDPDKDNKDNQKQDNQDQDSNEPDTR